MKQLSIFFALVLCFATSATKAQTLTMYDLNTSMEQSGVSIRAVADHNGKLYMTTTNTDELLQLWEYDPATMATTNIGDLGLEDEGNIVLVSHGSDLYATGAASDVCFKYDGASLTTAFTLDEGESCGIWEMVSFNGQLVFAAATDSTGTALMAFDGTNLSVLSDGTTSLQCAPDYGAQHMLKHNGDLYFVRESEAYGRELFKWDGTTLTPLEIEAGVTSSSANFVYATPHGLMWLASTSATGQEWAVTDGSSASLIPEIWNGTNGGAFGITLGILDSLVFLSGFDSYTDGSQPFVYDGTSVTKYALPSTWTSPDRWTAVGDTMYFKAYVNGAEQVFKFENDTSIQLFDAGSGAASQISAMGENNGKLYIGAIRNFSERILWEYDPATGDTTRLMASFEEFNFEFYETAQGLLFVAPTANTGQEPYLISDGNLIPVGDLNTGSTGSNPHELTSAGGNLYFLSGLSAAGSEVARWDNGSLHIYDLQPGPESPYPNNLVAFGDTLYFTLGAGPLYDQYGHELYKIVGDTADIGVDAVAGAGNSWPYGPTVLNNVLYFTGYDAVAGTEMYMFDGSTASITFDAEPGTGSSNPQHFAQVGDIVYFSAYTTASGSELYQYNTSTGIGALTIDMVAGSGGYSPSELTAHNGKLYFSAYDNNAGRSDLWSWDGTDTVRISAAWPHNLQPNRLTSFAGDLYFYGTSLSNGRELMRLDSATNTIELVADLNPGVDDSKLRGFVELDGMLYFRALSAATGAELYVYDPILDSVWMAADIAAGSLGGEPDDIIVHDGMLWFTANSRNGYGKELWSFDPESVPTNLRVRNLQDVSVKLEWDPMPEATDYRIQYKQTGTAGWTTLVKSGAPTCKHITGLTPSTNYRWRVAGKRSGVWGSWTEIESFRTLANPCAPITNVLTDPITPVQARINWGVVPFVAYYKIRWREVGGSWTYKNKDAIYNKHWLTGLTPGSSYEYQVKTVCPGAPQGTAWSALETFSTPSNKTEQTPTELLTKENSSVALQIVPNPNNGRFQLSMPAFGERVTVQLIDPIGRVVLHRELAPNQPFSEHIMLEQKTTGLHIVRITGNGVNYTSKLLVR